MITESELQAAAADVESDRVERKESLAAGDVKDKIGQAICAFSNDLPRSGKPGLILVGISDAGVPTNLPITDQLLLTLADMRSAGNILPMPTMTVEKRQVAGVDVAVVVVMPAADPPVRFKGVVWVRVGPRRAIASRDEERQLNEQRVHGNLTWDQHSVRGACVDDLDLDLVQRTILPAIISVETLAANERTMEERLAATHLLGADGRPTIAAVLLAGKDPQHWVPGARVQFVRFAGTDVTDPVVDAKDLRGPLVDQLRNIDDLLRINIKTAVFVGSGLTDVRTSDYPLVALQQLARNALLHRNYETSHAPVQVYWFSDRVEISNPGGLFGRVTAENFGGPHGNDYRNPILAVFFKGLGYVQQFGIGVRLARKACADNGNPLPEFGFGAGSALVTVLGRSAGQSAA